MPDTTNLCKFIKLNECGNNILDLIKEVENGNKIIKKIKNKKKLIKYMLEKIESEEGSKNQNKDNFNNKYAKLVKKKLVQLYHPSFCI